MRVAPRQATNSNQSPPPSPTGIDYLESKLAIDEHALDEACVQQPDLFYRAAKSYALCVSQRDAAKQALSEVEARADSQIRHDGEVAGDKLKEREVESMVLLDRDVMAAKRVLAELNERVGILGALKEAYSQRGYVIKELAGLWVAGYYSETSASASNQDIQTMRADRARRGRDSSQYQR
jgi:hypothetical protein